MKKMLAAAAAALTVGALAMLARYLLIQPPELAHQCEAAGAPLWCGLRLAIIMSYAWYGLGFLAVLTSAVALCWRTVPWATATLCSGAAAIVLYCYEPGALALVIGSLVLVRAAAPDGAPAVAAHADHADGEHQPQ